MSRKKEEWDIVDPFKQRAVEMCKDLRGMSAYNQALTLMQVRKKDPELAAAIVRILKVTREDLIKAPEEATGEDEQLPDGISG